MRWARHVVLVLIPMLASCAGPAFPETLKFDGGDFNRTGASEREGVSQASFVERGQTGQPPFQLTVYVSDEKRTAQDLHAWVSTQFNSSGAAIDYNSEMVEEECKIGTSGAGTPAERSFISLQVCQAGSLRAACVEANQKVTAAVLEPCSGDDACYQNLCDLRWETRRLAMTKLADDTVAQR